MGLVSRVSPVHTAMRNCTKDEGGPFEVGNQLLISSHRKLLSSKAMVVNVAESRNKISAGTIERYVAQSPFRDPSATRSVGEPASQSILRSAKIARLCSSSDGRFQ
jgi:hypothetical protein